MFLAKLFAFFRLFHQLTIGFKKRPTYFSILPLVFEHVFMILELVLIHVQPISAFYLWFSAIVQAISWFYHWFLSSSNLCQYSTTVFQATAQPISAFPLVCSLQSLFRIFQQLTVGVHLFFPLVGLVFISFFFRSLSHQLSPLCHCFSLFMFIHFHFVHHLLSFWHCLYMVFIVICFINFVPL